MPVIPSEPSPNSSIHRLACFASLLCLLVLALPLAADQSGSEGSASETPQRSQTVAGLLELLNAEMTEDVILLWLDTREADVAPLSAGDLLELHNAGASDAILAKLLRLAAGETSPKTVSPKTVSPKTVSPKTVSPKTAPSQPAMDDAPGAPATESELERMPEETNAAEAETRAPAAPAPSRPEPTPPTPSLDPTAATGDAIVDFTLSYVPDFRPDEKEWDLYVYLDGKPLSFVSQGSRVLGADAIQFQQALEPGQHQIRIVQERHEADDDAESFEGHFHEARVAPVDLFFRLEPGPAEVEISFERPLLEFRSAGPIAYRVAQNGRVLISQDEAGGDPEGWTPLCDDAQIAGDKPPRGCRNWATFWSVDAPPRHEVLRALSLFDYRPVPKNQRVH